MIRVTEIISAKNFRIVCKFNTGETKSLDIKPLIENHKHLNGIEKLYDENYFETAQVGAVGEIYWKDTITTEYKATHSIWNYDISPEFAYQIGE